MNDFFNFCGFFYSHAIYCIESGEQLVAFSAKENKGEKGELNRFVNEEKYEQSVDAARNYLNEVINNCDRCAIYYDGYYRFSEINKVDAIYMEAKYKVDGEIKNFSMVVPYQKKTFFKKLKIYKPKIIKADKFDNITLDKGLEEFWNGIYRHEMGSKVWNKHIDQSK